MSADHDHDHDHPHSHSHDEPARPAPAPEVSEDAGAQALSDALKRSFAVVKVIMTGLIVIFLFSGFFTVSPQEKAVILRFGKPVGDGRLFGPGPHWAFPPPIDEVIKIPVGQVQNISSTVGWYGTTAAAEAAKTEPAPGESLNPAVDGYLLTADENVIHVRGTLRFRIAEPGLRFALEFGDATSAVRNAFNNALIHAAARYKIDDALTRDQAGFIEAVRNRLQQLIVAHNLGIQVEQIDNMQIIPPRKLKEAFAGVLETVVRSDKGRTEALTYENQTVSKARAEATARKNTGETERTRLVEFVAAEVERFTNNLPAWRGNADLFRHQHQAEVLGIIFTNAQEKILVSDRGGPGRSIRLQINREPPKPKFLEQPKADKH